MGYSLYRHMNSKLDLLYPYRLLPSLTILSPFELEVNLRVCKIPREEVTVVQGTHMQVETEKNQRAVF